MKPNQKVPHHTRAVPVKIWRILRDINSHAGEIRIKVHEIKRQLVKHNDSMAANEPEDQADWQLVAESEQDLISHHAQLQALIKELPFYSHYLTPNS